MRPRVDARVISVLLAEAPAVIEEVLAASDSLRARRDQGRHGCEWEFGNHVHALAAAVDIGIYCYSRDGELTAARVGFGVLKMVSEATGPATVQLPGAVVAGPPMSLDAAPPPVQPVQPVQPTTVPSG